MARHTTIQLPTGQQISLGMKITLSVGPVQRFLVGDPDIQLIEAIGGRQVDEVAAAQQVLQKGEIAVRDKLLQAIAGEVVVRAWPGMTPAEKSIRVPARSSWLIGSPQAGSHFALHPGLFAL